MTTVARFATHVELDDASDARRLSLTARFEAVLADGRTVTLLADRGWSSSVSGDGTNGTADLRQWLPAEDIETTARTVVGPDEPFGGRTHEQMAADHWASIADDLGQRGVEADARELASLPHDVVLGERLRAWLQGA
ncbi:hypothetical protein ACLIYM_16515 [Streptomyces fenghuangensis]